MAHGARLDPPRIGERNLKVTPERYQKVKEVFSHACGLSDDERAAYLGHACADDPELRAEVEALLEHDQQSLPIRAPVSAREALGLDSDRHGLKGTTRLHELAFGECFLPERIGAFRIIRKIGQGGMGVVYEAEQDAPKRTIALKIIRPGAASEQVLRRFRFEAHVLGRLQHPGIAQVYEVGVAEVETPSGMKVEQPYFAMEYVRGKPLSELIPTLKWSTRQRLELFALICDAIHHAHQKGVIHRDLKPGNILVDETGRPKVLDFGVARITDSDVQVTTMQTDIGQLIGTIPYMSPEQIAGNSRELDTRSDVYALGVVCYQLLTGRLPYDLHGKTIPEASRAIAEDDPIRLSSLNRVFRGDLEAIVNKALEKDKERRYQSASDFAADVRRYLTDQPVSARPVTTIYQLRKFARRNKTLVGGILATFLALLLAVVGTASQAVRATREMERARDAETLAEQRRATAEAESAKFKAINQFFNDMLLAMDPAQEGRDVKVADVLERAVEKLDTALTEQPEVEASLQNTIGTIYVGLGMYREAYPYLKNAEETRRALLGAEHPDTLASLVNLAAVLKELSRWTEAEAVLRRTLAIRQAALGAESPPALETMNGLAEVLQKEGRVDEAEELWRRVLEIQRRVLPLQDPELLVTMNNLGQLLKQLSRPEEAEPLLREALDLQTKQLGVDHPHVLAAMNNLATTLRALGRLDEAETFLRRILETRERTVGAHPSTYLSMSNLSMLLVERGRMEEAEALARAALEGFRATVGPKHNMTLVAWNNLAKLLAGQDRLAEAETAYLDLLELARASLPPRHYMIQVFERNYGECLIRAQRWPEAEELLLNSLEALREGLGDRHEYTRQTAAALVELYTAWGRPDEAAKYAEPSPTSAPSEP